MKPDLTLLDQLLKKHAVVASPHAQGAMYSPELSSPDESSVDDVTHDNQQQPGQQEETDEIDTVFSGLMPDMSQEARSLPEETNTLNSQFGKTGSLWDSLAKRIKGR